MLQIRSIPVVALLAMLLSACGASGGGGKVQSAGTAVPRHQPSGVRAPVRRVPPPAQVQTLPGVAGVIGATAADLARQFGKPRLEVWEGDARKLQFSAAPCILDVFLYPAAPGREPQATYVDARRPSDGQDVDRAACIAALRQR